MVCKERSDEALPWDIQNFLDRSMIISSHPWKAQRIEEEHALKANHGLKRIGGMKEIWKAKVNFDDTDNKP